MNDLDAFLQLPFTVIAASICFVACVTDLLMVLLLAPRRDCFFLRMSVEGRLLALLVAPTLLISWPVVLYGLFLKSRGIGPEDLLDWDDD